MYIHILKYVSKKYRSYIYIYILRGKKDVTTFPDKPVS